MRLLLNQEVLKEYVKIYIVVHPIEVVFILLVQHYRVQTVHLVVGVMGVYVSKVIH